MSSPTSDSTKANAAKFVFQTPDVKASSEEDSKFSIFGLSPPPKTNNRRCSFEKSVKRITREFKDEWEAQPREDAPIQEIESIREQKKILLFLYSRGFDSLSNQPSRKGRISNLLMPGNTRVRMMQILKSEGDRDKSSEDAEHYVSTCLAIDRYFKQDGAKGFVADMASVKYYLRNQQYGSCFLQAPCVFASYLLQTYGLQIPPVDGSRLIRHNFTSEQLYNYAAVDGGGDSKAVFQIIEKHFFDCDLRQRQLDTILSSSLLEAVWTATVKSRLRKGPGLVSKFMIPKNFCVDKKGDTRPGFVRFTQWNKEGEWIVFSDPLDEQEDELARKLKSSCECPHPATNVDKLDDLTLITAASSMSFIDETAPYSYPESESEKASEELCDEPGDDISDEEPDSSEYESVESNRLQFGEGDITLHAMILLGVREANGEDFWVLQNSWSSMRIIEMSTEYFAQSEATIFSVPPKYFHPRRSPRSPIDCCPSPVAESGLLERADCESWEERHLIVPEEKQEGGA